MLVVKPKVFKKSGKQRCGKGFSREELKKAGSSLAEALKFGVPVDSRRRSCYDENVGVVKAFLQSRKAESKSKGKSKS